MTDTAPATPAAPEHPELAELRRGVERLIDLHSPTMRVPEYAVPPPGWQEQHAVSSGVSPANAVVWHFEWGQTVMVARLLAWGGFELYRWEARLERVPGWIWDREQGLPAAVPMRGPA